LTDPPALELANGFVLDGWTIEDAAAHRRFSVDPDSARFFGWTVEEAEAASDEHYREVVSRFQRDWREGTQLSLAIRERAGGEAVGAVELCPRDDGEAEASYLVDPAWRGRGLAPLALDAFVGWAHSELALRRVVLTCHPENLASQRVAEECGFALAGRDADELRYERKL
jgi:RimJ/RimL family protein N-acetyltransferase